MPKPLISAAALRDYDEAIEWYLERSEKAALGFEQAVSDGIAKIVANPERWAKCDEQHRFHILKRYPFSIIYRVQGDTIEITAIAHGKRRPQYWKR